MNPVDALAQQGRDSRRAEGREHRIWMPTDQDIGQWAEEIGVDRGAATITLNVRMSEQAQGILGEEELAGLARSIQVYGDDRVADFQEELRRETE
jgi:hypothetical protein